MGRLSFGSVEAGRGVSLVTKLRLGFDHQKSFVVLIVPHQEDSNTTAPSRPISLLLGWKTGRVAGQSGSRGEQGSGTADQVAGSSPRLPSAREASAVAVTAAESAAATGLDGTRGKGGQACEVGAPTRGSGEAAADEDGVCEGADGAAALMEFQRLVTVAVQKEMLDMCDARVRIKSPRNGAARNY